MFTDLQALMMASWRARKLTPYRARVLQCPLVVSSVQFIWIVTQESLFQGEKKGRFLPLKYLLLKCKAFEKSFFLNCLL